MRKTIAATIAALTIGGGMVGVGVAGLATAATTETKTVTRTDHLPPFWRVDPADWCNEDMVCWIGSGADGRSDAEALADWDRQMHIALDNLQTVFVYLADADTDGEPLEVSKASVSDVGRCTGTGFDRTCQARLAGFNRGVFVSGVDFPGK